MIVELNQNRTLSWTLAYYGGGYLVALAIAHLLVRRYAPYADPLLLPIVALLNGIGLVMIYRLDLARDGQPRSTAARRCPTAAGVAAAGLDRPSRWSSSWSCCWSSATTPCCSPTRTPWRWSG